MKAEQNRNPFLTSAVVGVTTGVAIFGSAWASNGETSAKTFEVGVTCPDGTAPSAFEDHSLNRHVERAPMSLGSVPVRIVCGRDGTKPLSIMDMNGASHISSPFSGFIEITAHPAQDPYNSDATTAETDTLAMKISKGLGAVLLTNADSVEIHPAS